MSNMTSDEIITQLGQLLATNTQGNIDASTMRAALTLVTNYGKQIEEEIDEAEIEQQAAMHRYTVSYNSNGGTGYMTPSYIDSSSSNMSFAVKECLFSRDGYTFNGFLWNGNTYSVNGSISGSRSLVNLTTSTLSAELEAQWKAIVLNKYTYTLSFNMGLSTSNPSSISSITSGEVTDKTYSFTIPTTVPTDTNGVKRFKCWGTSSTGGTIYNPGDYISLTYNNRSLQLYGQWETIPIVSYTYSITYVIETDGETLMEEVTQTSTSTSYTFTVADPDTLFSGSSSYEKWMDGYEFTYWVDNKTGYKYNVGGSIILKSNNTSVTIYGKRDVALRSITYNIPELNTAFSDFTITDLTSGTIIDTDTNVESGHTVKITYKLNKGYSVSSTTVTGASSYNINSGTITFVVGDSDITVSISTASLDIKLLYPTITYSDNEHPVTIASAYLDGVSIDVSDWETDGSIGVSQGSRIVINYSGYDEYDTFLHSNSQGYVTIVNSAINSLTVQVNSNITSSVNINISSTYSVSSTTDYYYVMTATVKERTSMTTIPYDVTSSPFVTFNESPFVTPIEFCMFVVIPSGKTIESCIIQNEFLNDIASKFVVDTTTETRELRSRIGSNVLYSFHNPSGKDLGCDVKMTIS